MTFRLLLAYSACIGIVGYLVGKNLYAVTAVFVIAYLLGFVVGNTLPKVANKKPPVKPGNYWIITLEHKDGRSRITFTEIKAENQTDAVEKCKSNIIDPDDWVFAGSSNYADPTLVHH